jgi:hypothetical protein
MCSMIEALPPGKYALAGPDGAPLTGTANSYAYLTVTQCLARHVWCVRKSTAYVNALRHSEMLPHHYYWH